MDRFPDVARILVLAGLLVPEDAGLPLADVLRRLAQAGALEAARAELADPARFAELTVVSSVPLAEQAADFERAAAAFDPQATVLDRDAPTAIGAGATVREAYGSFIRLPDVPPVVPGAGITLPADYTLVRALGQGGMGAVYLVRSAAGEELALKTFSPAFAARAEGKALARFVAEAQAAALLDHPDIIACHDLGRLPSGAPYYTMPRLAGIELGELLRWADKPGSEEHSRYDLLGKLRLLLRVCRAVGHAHRQGMLHRDLKPSNVMVGNEGQIWVVDWGLSSMTNDERRMTNRELPAGGPRLTLAGQMMGTLGYMPPEQAEGELERIGPPADVHALGAMLYELLAGVPPYTGENYVNIVVKLLQEGPPPLPASPLASIAMKCLAREPAERYPNADALADELQGYLDHRPVAAHGYSVGQRALLWLQRHPALGAAGLLLVLAGGGLLGLVQQRRVRQRDLETNLARARQAALADRRQRARDQLAAYDKALFTLKQALRKQTARWLVVYTDPRVAFEQAPREPPEPERLLEFPLREWRARRVAARALLRQLDRAGHPLPDTAAITARLAAEELAYHAAAAGWIEAATITSARLHAMATNATPEWKPVLRAQASSLPELSKILAARGTLVTGKLPPGATATLSRYDTNPKHTVYPLIFLRSLPAKGAVLDLPIGSYRVTLLRGKQQFHFPVLVERPLLAGWHDPRLPARLEFRLPRDVPAGFVYCPGGLFLAGGDAPNSLPPSCRARVGPFLLARHETTIREYVPYLTDLTDGAPNDDWPLLRFASTFKQLLNKPDGSLAVKRFGLTPAHPVFGINLAAARRYARWKAKQTGRKLRLPTELEWAYAARGADGRTYPWGDLLKAGLANLKSATPHYWAPPGSYSRDLSPLGILDQGGNLREWTATKTPDDLWIIRGGSWGSSANYAKCAARDASDPVGRSPSVGFRLAGAPSF